MQLNETLAAFLIGLLAGAALAAIITAFVYGAWAKSHLGKRRSGSHGRASEHDIGSLVHEICQPITAIVNYTQGSVRRMRASTPNLPAVFDAIERIGVQANRAAELVHDLQTLLRRSEAQLGPLNINTLLQHIVQTTHGAKSNGGTPISLDLANDLPPVHADPNQIQQAVLELVRCRLSAHSDNGQRHKLVLRTSMLDAKAIEISIVGGGDDDQPLVSEALSSPPTERSLRMSRGIIENHGGKLWITGERGLAPTYRFTLPVAESH